MCFATIDIEPHLQSNVSKGSWIQLYETCLVKHYPYISKVLEKMVDAFLEVQRVVLQVSRKIVDVQLVFCPLTVFKRIVPYNKGKKLRLALLIVSLKSLSSSAVHYVLDEICFDYYFIL
jgi:hypothetical protein